MADLLAHRRALKKKKPTFLRQDAHKKVKISNNWRKPKGSDSKMRVYRKGYRRCVAIGWGSPSAVKGATREGLVPVMVSCKKDIMAVDKNKSCIMIKSSVGTKKRLELLAFAKEKGVKVGNFKDAEAYAAAQKSRLDSRKKAAADKAKKRSAEKEKVKKEAEKKAKKDAEKSEAAEAPSVEEKKAEEKKEQDKVLTKRK